MKKMTMKKKSSKKRISTDYLFEAYFFRVKTFVTSNKPSRTAIVKILGLAIWFKDIN